MVFFSVDVPLQVVKASICFQMEKPLQTLPLPQCFLAWKALVVRLSDIVQKSQTVPQLMTGIACNPMQNVFKMIRIRTTSILAAPVERHALTPTCAGVSHQNLAFTAPTGTLAHVRDTRPVERIRLDMRVAARELLSDWHAPVVRAPVDFDFTPTLGDSGLPRWRRRTDAVALAPANGPVLTKLGRRRGHLAVFQQKVVFRSAVEIPAHSAQVSLVALGHVDFNVAVAVPRDLQTEAGYHGEHEVLFAYLQVGQAVKREAHPRLVHFDLQIFMQWDHGAPDVNGQRFRPTGRTWLVFLIAQPHAEVAMTTVRGELVPTCSVEVVHFAVKCFIMRIPVRGADPRFCWKKNQVISNANEKSFLWNLPSRLAGLQRTIEAHKAAFSLKDDHLFPRISDYS